MSILFVARSPGLQDWASDVGLTKHVYRLGVAEADVEAEIARLNAEKFAGWSDWLAMRQRKIEGEADEAALRARLAAKEKVVDPTYYPKLRGAEGLFKIKTMNVEHSLFVKRTLAGKENATAKVKPNDIADYMLDNALGAVWVPS